MKKTFILLLLVRTTVNILIGQSYFSNKYLLGMNICQLLAAAPDGGYYFSGRSNNFDAIIGKVDSAGNLEWAKQVGGNPSETPRDIVVLNNENIVVAMTVDSGAFSSSQQTYLTSFDVNGNYVFSKRFVNADSVIFNAPINIIKDGDGFTIAISSVSPIKTDTRFLKLDSLGNKIKSVFLNQPNDFIYKISNGGYLLHGLYGCTFVRMDSSFNYQNALFASLSFLPGIYGIIQLLDGSFIYYGGSPTFVCKINSQLDYEWAYFYYYDLGGTGGYGENLGTISYGKQIDNNSLVFYGGAESPSHLYILQIDTAGNVEKCRSLIDSSKIVETMFSRCLFSNNKFVFIRNLTQGLYNPPNLFNITCTDSSFSQMCNVADSLVSKVLDPDDYVTNVNLTSGLTNDSLINDSLPIINISFPFGDCATSTLGINQLNNELTSLNISPNPATENISIEWTSSKNEIANLSILDVDGRLILNDVLKSNQKKLIDVLSFARGIYFVRITSNEKMFYNKFVKR